MREPKAVGRPREFDEDQALKQIMTVFWERGYEGASMQDLMAATGLQKGSLYAAFGDKRAMYLKALSHYDRSAIDNSVRILTDPGAPEKRIAAFLQAAVEAVEQRNDRRGCFLCNASVDQAVEDAETGRAVERSLGRLSGALEAALSEHGQSRLTAKQRRAAAQHLLSVYVGLRVLAKAGHSVSALKAAKTAALQSL